MKNPLHPDAVETLAEARELISRQATQIEALSRQLAHERFAAQLRDHLRVAAVGGAIAISASHNRLLELIVQTAVQIISARAAALLLIDPATQELVFEIALGQRAEEVKKFRIPIGQGIVGLVAITGQPIAVADAQNDPQHALNIARSIGYMPQSILCVPLFHEDHITGVLELLDKTDGTTFSPADMETLMVFADMVAIAIQASRIQGVLPAMVTQLLIGADADAALQQDAQDFVADLSLDADLQRALALARLVHDIAARGPHETQLVETVLKSFQDYFRHGLAAI